MRNRLTCPGSGSFAAINAWLLRIDA